MFTHTNERRYVVRNAQLREYMYVHAHAFVYVEAHRDWRSSTSGPAFLQQYRNFRIIF